MKNNRSLNNQKRCVLSLILCSLIGVLVFIGLLIRMFLDKNSISGLDGLEIFRMFTILSNTIVAVVSILSIPYTIDGLRNNNYHLPRWIVDTLFVGVSLTTITFTISISVLTITLGLYNAMFAGTNILFHTTIPLLALLMFVFSNSYHTISFKKSLFALILPCIYMTIYGIMVFGIGEENGGWTDFYGIGTFFPWYIGLIIILPLFFGLIQALRFFHNKAHIIQKENIINYYLTNEKYECASIEEAIKVLVKENKQKDPNSDLIIPRRIIKWFMERYQAKNDLTYYMSIYIDEYQKWNKNE